MDFEKICMMFTMQEPYYGILLSSMNRVSEPRVGTLGVGRSGNVFRLYYNPAFVEKLTIDQALQLLKHEVLHVAFNHFTIWDGEDKNDTPAMHDIRNIAADLEVNSYLDQRILRPIGGMFPDDFGWDKFEGTREYYSRLISKNQQQQTEEANDPTQPCNGGLGGNSGTPNKSKNKPSPSQLSEQSGSSQEGAQDSSRPNNLSQAMQSVVDKSFDDHSMWPDDVTDAEAEQLEQIIDDMLIAAEQEVIKGRGTVPEEMVMRLDKIKSKKPKPVADWKRFFRRYLGNEFSEFIRKSKKRESRRFPDAAGNRHRRKSHILVAIDTSGSVSMPEYMEFFGQIKTLTAVADFHVVECDAEIQHEYDYKGKANDNLHGGGGTDFQPVIDLYNKDKKKYDALVYFTDGYCYIPSDTPKDTLWVISSQGDQSDRAKYRVNGASVAFIPKAQ